MKNKILPDSIGKYYNIINPIRRIPARAYRIAMAVIILAVAAALIIFLLNNKPPKTHPAGD